jgi:hypothetical protein
MVLTVAMLRKLLEGKPDNAAIAVQGDDPSFAAILDVGSLDDCAILLDDSTLVLRHTDDGAIVDIDDEDDENDD